MPIWILVWSAAHDPFLFCRIQTASFSDRSLLIWRENVSRAGEEAFRRYIFEYMSHHNLFVLGRIQTPVFSDRPFFSCVCICHGQLNRRSGDLFEYMYNLSCIILDSRLQGTAHESEEIELQGVMIWFLINSRVRVLISDSWSFLRWCHQRILCEKDTCCSLCSWLFWMCVTCKSRSVRLSISSIGRSFARWSCWMKPAVASLAKVSSNTAPNVQRRRKPH